jgi:hypothetical protein
MQGKRLQMARCVREHALEDISLMGIESKVEDAYRSLMGVAWSAGSRKPDHGHRRRPLRCRPNPDSCAVASAC